MLTEDTSRMTISEQTNITVIIPVYNCREYLAEAVSSVLRQPYQRIQIVLIDDGSTDGSGQICDELGLKNSRITVLHQKNAGVSAARNAGIVYALQNETSMERKHYLAFLDADDCWTEEFFDNATVDALPETAMIRFRSAKCNSHLTNCTVSKCVKNVFIAGGAQTVGMCLGWHFGAALYAASILRNHSIRFVEGMKNSEDVLFLRTCVYNAETITMDNRVLYLYRNNPASCVHAGRKYGFTHFEPMLQAYMQHDFNGTDFVAWYFVDAIEEHFRFGGTVPAAVRWMQQHETYVDIAREYGGNRAEKVLVALENHPYCYAIPRQIKGVAYRIMRYLIHIPLLATLMDLFRYREKIPNYRKESSN